MNIEEYTKMSMGQLIMILFLPFFQGGIKAVVWTGKHDVVYQIRCKRSKDWSVCAINGLNRSYDAGFL